MQQRVLKYQKDFFINKPLHVLKLALIRARFGYEAIKIHPSTKVAIYQTKEQLERLDAQSVYGIVQKVLRRKNSHLFFETLFELGVLDVVFPSIYVLTTLKEGSIYHKEDSVFIHTMMVLKELDDESIVLKLTALYHDIAKPYCYRNYGNSSNHEDATLVEPLMDMQIPENIKKRVLFLIANHVRISLLEQMRRKKVVQFFESFSGDTELLEELIRFKEADDRGRICDREKRLFDSNEVLKEFENVVKDKHEQTYSKKL